MSQAASTDTEKFTTSQPLSRQNVGHAGRRRKRPVGSGVAGAAFNYTWVLKDTYKTEL